MPYSKTTWVDRNVQFPNRFTKSNESGTSVDLAANPGTVTNAGTPLSASNLNKIENGIANALEKTGDTMTGVLNVTAGTVTAPAIAPTGDSNTGIFFPAADTVAIGEGGTEVLRINPSGNVGIGTTSPTAKLDVVGTMNVSSDGSGPASLAVAGFITAAFANFYNIEIPYGQITIYDLPSNSASATNKQYVDNVSVGSQIYGYKNFGGAL